MSGSITAVMPSFTGPAVTTMLGRKSFSKTASGLNIGDDDLGLFAQVIVEEPHGLADADLEVIGREGQSVVLEQLERLDGIVELDLGLLESAAGIGGVFDQAAQVDRGETGQFCFCIRSTKS